MDKNNHAVERIFGGRWCGIGTMVIAILVLLHVPSLGCGQVISMVSFDVVAGDKIEVEYYFAPLKESDVFDITVLASNDNGQTFVRAKSLSGDVSAVSKPGKKQVLWNVLNDCDVFEGDACIVKVFAKPRYTFWDFLGDVFLGSEGTKEMSNGFALRGGVHQTNFTNDAFRKSESAKLFTPAIGYQAGMRYAILPIVFDACSFSQDLKVPQLQGGDVVVKHGGVSGSLSYTVLPVFKYVLVSVGGGYQHAAFYVGDPFKDNVSTQLIIGSPFAKANLELSLASWLKLGVEYKQSVKKYLSGSDPHDWYQILGDVGLKF